MLSQNRSIERPVQSGSIKDSSANSSTPSALIAPALRQALSACDQENWSETIAACQQAIALCKQAVSQRKSSSTQTVDNQAESLKKAEALFKQGEQLKHQGDVAGSVRACLEALKQQPQFYKAYNRLRYNLMRYDIADNDALLNEIVSVCEQNISRYPQLHSGHVALGYALTKLGRLEDAIACYRQASDFMTLRQLKAVSATGPDLTSSLLPQRLQPSFMVIGAEKCGTTSLYQ